jgi:YesN/AraC family two-component response regulator
MSYHPNYLRRVFRQHTGMNFSDYLSEYRINKVKQWLLDTDMKISEIATRVGYQNSQNLIRMFKRSEGITPGEYRSKKLNS